MQIMGFYSDYNNYLSVVDEKNTFILNDYKIEKKYLGKKKREINEFTEFSKYNEILMKKINLNYSQ